jgi:uncharacterized metal-binding protein
MACTLLDQAALVFQLRVEAGMGQLSMQAAMVKYRRQGGSNSSCLMALEADVQDGLWAASSWCACRERHTHTHRHTDT